MTLTARAHIALRCLRCSATLVQRDDTGYVCPSCTHTYPARDGIVSFVQDDGFYEGAYDATLRFVPDEHSMRDRFMLYFVNQHLPWAIYKYIRDCRTILDVACGGGMRYLARKGPVVGLDLSAASLRKASSFYSAALQADAFDVPLHDRSCGYVVSQYFFEHVEPSRKPDLLGEWRRVLEPGGRLLMLMTCDADNAIFRFAKTDPETYRRSFIERDHHYGLQPPSANLRVIREAGFDIDEVRPAGKSLLQHLPVLLWLEDYGNRPAVMDILVRTAAWVNPRRYANFAYTAAVTLVDDVLDRFLPLDAASLLLVVARRSD